MKNARDKLKTIFDQFKSKEDFNKIISELVFKSSKKKKPSSFKIEVTFNDTFK